jgi:hypothetical protein
VNEGHTFSADGIEVRRAVLTAEEIDAIKAEVSVDHETLRRTGVRNRRRMGLACTLAGSLVKLHDGLN